MAAFIEKYMARAVGAIVAGLSVFLADKLGIVIDPDAMEGLKAFLNALFMAIGLLVYGIVHSKIDSAVTKKAGGSDEGQS